MEIIKKPSFAPPAPRLWRAGKASAGRENIIISWFVWHFYEMPKFLFSVWNNFILFSTDLFSVPLLLKTFFSPWRRYKWDYPKGFNVANTGEFLSTLTINLFSRFIGVLAKTVLIIMGIIITIFILIIGITIIFTWFLVPFLIVFSLWFIFLI